MRPAIRHPWCGRFLVYCSQETATAKKTSNFLKSTSMAWMSLEDARQSGKLGTHRSCIGLPSLRQKISNDLAQYAQGLDHKSRQTIALAWTLSREHDIGSLLASNTCRKYMPLSYRPRDSTRRYRPGQLVNQDTTGLVGCVNGLENWVQPHVIQAIARPFWNGDWSDWASTCWHFWEPASITDGCQQASLLIYRLDTWSHNVKIAGLNVLKNVVLSSECCPPSFSSWKFRSFSSQEEMSEPLPSRISQSWTQKRSSRMYTTQIKCSQVERSV